MFPEGLQMFPERLQMVPERLQLFPECLYAPKSRLLMMVIAQDDTTGQTRATRELQNRETFSATCTVGYVVPGSTE
jgi:hypothetical protein